MYRIKFYEDKNGEKPVLNYLRALAKRGDKNSRVNSDNINDCITALREHGTRVGMPTVRHLGGDIWELRPLSNRILFAAWDGDCFVLLNHFVKKTQKTPQREINKAKRLLADYRKRNG